MVAEPVTLAPLVEVRCRCGSLLFRHRPPEPGAAVQLADVEIRCPNRRCRRLQWVRVPVDVPRLVVVQREA